MTLYSEPQVWREQFPLGEARPFSHDYHGLRYPGEVIRGETWSAGWGEPLQGDIFFRIVLLRQRRGGLHPAVQDPRSVLCLPASPMKSGRGRLTGLIDFMHSYVRAGCRSLHSNVTERKR